ncbi:MAG: hypothetical protein GY797_26390 [Deltaproteobacteria bacterium]|nr:hypothetical protein [Deltaproteobacteria bacterium]
MVISGSSSRTAFYFIVQWTRWIRSGEVGKVIKLVKINGHFRGMKHDHASGIQLSGSVLAVGTEGGGDPIKSSVVFYDLSDVYSPRPVGNRINRSWDTAGAVGLVKRSSDYLLAVGGWDSNRVDFYRSNNAALASTRCVFTRFKTWEESRKNTSGWIDDNWGVYQGVNLLRESNGRLYLVGFNRNTGGHDWGDLYSVNLNASASRMLKKIDKKHVYCRDGASFRWGGGLYAPRPTMKITLLAVERDFHGETTVNCF